MSSIREEMKEMIQAADALFQKIEAATQNSGTFWAVSEILEKNKWDAYKMSEQLREIKYYLGV